MSSNQSWEKDILTYYAARTKTAAEEQDHDLVVLDEASADRCSSNETVWVNICENHTWFALAPTKASSFIHSFKKNKTKSTKVRVSNIHPTAEQFQWEEEAGKAQSHVQEWYNILHSVRNDKNKAVIGGCCCIIVVPAAEECQGHSEGTVHSLLL